MKKFIVNRETWYRGDEENAALLNGEGKMCCSGFAALACGYTKDEIHEQGEPESLCNLLLKGNKREKVNLWPEGFVEKSASRYRNTREVRNIISTNDDDEITDEEREKYLTELFETLGIEVEFIG